MTTEHQANRGVRAFIGVSLPARAHQYLQPLIDSLAASGKRAGVRWVAPVNRHITLVFLGQVQPAQLSPLLDLLSDLGRRTAPFEVTFDQIRQFPDAKSSVVAAMLHPAAPLAALFEQLQSGCEALGFDREKRRFQPHVTLGRLRGRKRWLEETLPLDLTLTVDTLQLLRSTPTPSGSHYSVLGSAALDTAASSAPSMAGKRNSKPDSKATSG